jgi:DNA repair exonuclease SbcCD ATPase subunit/predicted MPP superfamily phosphohydrolase
MTKYLTTPIKKFTHIVHVADVHIRLLKRHDEYREVFDKFYKEIDKTPDTTIVAILGDLFHNKTDLVPESIKLASDFLKTIADKRTTILISGNHDATLNNKTRLDSLTSVVEPLNHPNLFYLKDSGLFVVGNILFNHYSVFDDYTKYIPASNIPKKLINETDVRIGLFHGPVQGATTDVGYRVASKTVSNDSFDGHDIVLLGDIHKFQRLQEHSINYNKPVIIYAGSMIQQNHGESLEKHGYVMWDIKHREYTHVELQNDYGFFTVEIEKGKLLTDVSNMPKKVTLRAKCKETIPSEVKSLMAKISNKHELIEITYDKINTDEEKKNIIDTTNINLISIASNVDYQNQLIKEFLLEKKREVMTDELIDQIFEINKDVNSKLEKELVPRNIRWKPKRFEFENMFSYGEGNVIDFTTLKGLIGLFAANASGKSSILSALSYCLFDKCDRAFKAIHVLNTQKMSFNCKFNFEIEGVDYFIERIGVQDKKGNVKVDVKFYQLDKDNKMIDLNGEARRNTNDVIRDYIGTYDDFLLTVLSIQNNSVGNFIDMGQADRKDLIAKFMGITVYDQLDQIAKSESKEITTLLKNYSKTDYPKLLEQRIQEIALLKRSIETENIELDKLDSKFKYENDRLMEEMSNIINIGNAPTNINLLESNKKRIVSEKESLTDTNAAIKQLVEKLKDAIEQIDSELNKFDLVRLKKETDHYDALNLNLVKIQNEIDKKTIELASKGSILSSFGSNIDYDPNCTFCVKSNKKHADHIKKTRDEYSKIQMEIGALTIRKDDIVDGIKLVHDVVEKNKKINDFNYKKTDLEKKYNHANSEFLKNSTKLVQFENQLLTLEQDIQLYYKEKDAIESNKLVNEKIKIIKDNITKLDNLLKTATRKVSDLNGKLVLANEQKSNYEEQIKNAKIWELQQQAYTYYMMAISRDGIPYNLISKALPTIESEINNILHQIVEFTVNLITDGKNVIGHINYDGKKWPIEMGSGLEKFVLSLAIRVALINISNLPRPNFIAIDEGFGCADKDNLNSMSSLLSYFRSTFDFIWVVSHLDAMKDMVDNQLEIKKERGFSKIVAV